MLKLESFVRLLICILVPVMMFFFSEARSRLLTITFLYTKENMLNMEMF